MLLIIRSGGIKKLFLKKGKSQGHKVTDLCFNLKGIIYGVHMPNMKSISYGSKVIVKVKVDDRQTDRI